ncbi:MAG: monovalent cation:proton antiporter-2 (CPA2) family protein [Pseudomonadota bacterium]|jgi:monovalent cation:H+ antiporter-2, CPA2 family
MEILQIALADIPAPSYLREAIIFLLSAVLVTSVFQRFKISPVLGYLLTGVIIGPFGLKAISDIEDARTLGELGVVFLLFTIGLELSADRLRSMARLIFGLGSAQMAVTGAIIGVISWAWGNTIEASIVLGFCLAMSSTAIATQMLLERNEFSSNLGRAVFAVLLLQDLAVAPLLVLVNALGEGQSALPATLAIALGKSVFAVGVIILAGRLTLRPLFRAVADSRNPEVLMALTLLAILVTAVSTHAAGLSMALGAFLAGMLLSETEFRHQVEIDIQPFKGLLLGLFFIGVGMGIDLDQLSGRFTLVVIAVLGLIAVKTSIFLILGRLFRLPLADNLQSALLLGTGGEFALLVVGAAISARILDPAIGQFMLVTAALSMALAPFMLPLAHRLLKLLPRPSRQKKVSFLEEIPKDVAGHVIIAGFGRVGQTIASLLNAQKVPYIALDLAAPAAGAYRKSGLPVYYGDIARDEVLERLDIGRAAAVVLTIDTPLTAKKALSAIRSRWPHVPVFVRARDASHSRQLEILGATGVVPETLESSLALAGQVLGGIGAPLEAVNMLVNRIRDEHYAGMSSIGRREAGEAEPVKMGHNRKEGG